MVSCGEEEKKIDPAQDVLNEAVVAHGELGNYYFVFRENLYSFEFKETGDYRFPKNIKTDSLMYEDILTQDGFTRISQGDTLVLSEEDQEKYSESLNSVIYFMCLPQKLNDPAVNKELMDPIEVQGKKYHTLKVTFSEDGGGKDFQDIFYYWFNTETHELDYFAYSYEVNGGGVRFRQAINPRRVEGMLFQDYINYEAPVGTDLDYLPALFEQNELVELSRIEVSDIMPF